MPRLSRIFVYPIKSCRGIEVREATVGTRGLDGDRRYMVVDGNGRFVTQRQFPQMALVETALTPDGFRVSAPGHEPLELPARIAAGADGATGCRVRVWQHTVEATLARSEINVWFSAVLGFACGLAYMADDQHRPVQNEAAGFDDEVSFADGAPLLLTSEASLADLNARLDRPVTMAHFRPNLVVAAERPFEEDDWDSVEVGDASFDVAWPSSRCIMTTIDPETGVRREDGEPMRTLKGFRQRGPKVYFGQNLLPRRLGRITSGVEVAVN